MTRFLRVWAICLAGFALGTVCLTVAVDPYGILGTPRIPGLTADKPAAADWPRLTKAYMVERVQPATILLGSSNVDVGIDPDSPAWPAASRPVFNLAIDGAGPQTQLEYLQHALVTTSPKLVLVGVSFEDAMAYPPAPSRRLSADNAAQWSYEARLRTRPNGEPNPDHGLARLKDLVFATLSIRAVRDSLVTLANQDSRFISYQTEHGQNNGGQFLRWATSEGQYSLFMDKDRQKASEFARWRRQPMTEVAPTGDLIRLAQGRGARMIVFIIPSHVEKLEMWRQLGMTPLYQAWKAELAGVVEAAGAAGNPVPLWDFGVFSPYTTEQVPAPRDVSTTLEWIWEPVHFRPQLGTLMVEEMVDGTRLEALGTQITTADLPGQAKMFADAQRRWVTDHPADVARIATVIAAAITSTCRKAEDDCTDPRATASH